MFETSSDILRLALTISIALIAIFAVWLLAESAYFMHQTNKFMSGCRKKITKIENAIGTVGDKIEHMVAFVPMIAALVKQSIESFTGSPKSKGRKK